MANWTWRSARGLRKGADSCDEKGRKYSSKKTYFYYETQKGF
jgi:hypothetical protein